LGIRDYTVTSRDFIIAEFGFVQVEVSAREEQKFRRSHTYPDPKLYYVAKSLNQHWALKEGSSSSCGVMSPEDLTLFARSSLALIFQSKRKVQHSLVSLARSSRAKDTESWQSPNVFDIQVTYSCAMTSGEARQVNLVHLSNIAHVLHIHNSSCLGSGQV
jgi:hypothetical protein